MKDDEFVVVVPGDRVQSGGEGVRGPLLIVMSSTFEVLTVCRLRLERSVPEDE